MLNIAHSMAHCSGEDLAPTGADIPAILTVSRQFQSRKEAPTPSQSGPDLT